MARWQNQREACPDCGQSREVCGDPARDWFPQRTICYATMESANANRAYDKHHEGRQYHDGTFKTWTAKRTIGTPYHFRDGVTVWVASADLNPHDHFLGDKCDECDGSDRPVGREDVIPAHE